MARRKQEWVIRVIQFTEDRERRNVDLSGIWIENLRYLGLIKLHEDHKQLRDMSTKCCDQCWAHDYDKCGNADCGCHEYLYKSVFDIYAPHDTPDTKYWADRMAARMASFGINAVAAPLWVSHAQGPETPDTPPRGLRV